MNATYETNFFCTCIFPLKLAIFNHILIFFLIFKVYSVDMKKGSIFSHQQSIYLPKQLSGMCFRIIES